MWRVIYLFLLRRLLLISLHCLQCSLEQMICSVTVVRDHISDHEVCEAVHVAAGLQHHLRCDRRTLHLCTKTLY